MASNGTIVFITEQKTIATALLFQEHNLKHLYFAHVRISFLRLLSETIVQIAISNGSVIEAHDLEYRFSVRLILTVPLCTEHPIDNVKWYTAVN